MTDTTDPTKPVAWAHPEMGWVDQSYDVIRRHCLNDGPMPVPLVRLSEYERVKAENEEVRAGIKRLSDEEELCGETMPEEDAFSLVRMAAKLAEYEKANVAYVDANTALIARSEALEAEVKRLREALSIVPSHCSGSSLAFEPGVLHVNKDGSGYIAINEADFILEDDRDGEGGGSLHWIARMDASEIIALRDFLNGNTTADRLADKIEDLIAEFGDDPKAAMQCVSEHLGLRRHAKATSMEVIDV